MRGEDRLIGWYLVLRGGMKDVAITQLMAVIVTTKKGNEDL